MENEVLSTAGDGDGAGAGLVADGGGIFGCRCRCTKWKMWLKTAIRNKLLFLL